MSEGKRIRRTPEQIVADLDVQIKKLKDSILELENKKAAAVTEFDNKIAAVKEKIAKLEAKKKDVLTPKKRKPRKSKAEQIKLLVRQAQKSGMKLDEIADKLGMAPVSYTHLDVYKRQNMSCRIVGWDFSPLCAVSPTAACSEYLATPLHASLLPEHRRLKLLYAGDDVISCS